jgi:hypothetical protein
MSKFVDYTSEEADNFNFRRFDELTGGTGRKTLLDEFAMAALTGMLAATDGDDIAALKLFGEPLAMLAVAAYNIAEAMNAESIKRHEAIKEKCRVDVLS